MPSQLTGAAGARSRIAPTLLPLLAVGLLLAACSAASAAPTPSMAPSPSPFVAASVESTATPRGSSGPELHIDLAANWQEVELTEAALRAQMQVLAQSNPQQAAVIKQLLDSRAWEGFELYALGYDGLALIGNINVTTAPVGGPLDAAMPAFEGQLRQIGATDIEMHHVTLVGVDSIVVDYHLPIKNGTTTVAFTGRISLIPIDAIAYIVTVTCYASDPSSCLADGDAMVAGMTVGP